MGFRASEAAIAMFLSKTQQKKLTRPIFAHFKQKNLRGQSWQFGELGLDLDMGSPKLPETHRNSPKLPETPLSKNKHRGSCPRNSPKLPETPVRVPTPWEGQNPPDPKIVHQVYAYVFFARKPAFCWNCVFCFKSSSKCLVSAVCALKPKKARIPGQIPFDSR